MNRNVISRVVMLALIAVAAYPQDAVLAIPWDDLAAKATNKVFVSLEGPLLQLAAGSLSGSKPDEARVKRLLANLKGIYVRSLEFDADGQYSKGDVSKLRALFSGSNWSSVVNVQERGGDDVGVFVRSDGGQITGLAVVAAEPKELTVVQIIGALDPTDLAALGGTFGIPKMSLDFSGKAPGKKK